MSTDYSLNLNSFFRLLARYVSPKVIGILILLILIVGYLAITEPDKFLLGANIQNLLRRTALFGILGIGVAFVIITSGIDLSIGSIVGLCGVLLALFLTVNYAAVDQADVIALKGRQSQVYVQPTAAFKPGDLIRYDRGRRAEDAILTVKSVKESEFETKKKGALPATLVTFDKKLLADDTYGRIAKTYKVLSFKNTPDQTSKATLVIQGAHNNLAPKDRVELNNEDGLKDIRIISASVDGDKTTLKLDEELGDDFNDKWMAVPIKRKQRMTILSAVGWVALIALALGIIHGLLVTKVNLQPFVVTLCGLLFYRGISRWLVDDQPQGFGSEFDETLRPLATGKFVLTTNPDGTSALAIPYPFFILLGVAILAAIFLNKTVYGRYIQALGRNEEAARYSGINTKRVTIVAYVICTLLGALGGILFALESNSISPSEQGNFFELYAIAAAVLGGCSLRGGEGGIFGVVIGTALMQTLNNLINLKGISDTLEFAIIGAVILIGVIADELLRRIVAKRRAVAQANADAIIIEKPPERPENPPE